jgi:hypothetical protein
LRPESDAFIIFGAKILNYLLLSMVYPTSQDQEQQLPGF